MNGVTLFDNERALFAKYSAILKGMAVSHVWNGRGSAIFLEFGELRPWVHGDGSEGEPDGQASIMIEWSWRIERERSILTGSFEENEQFLPLLKALIGARVVTVGLFSRLPELVVAFDNGMRLLSFNTSKGDPQWCIFDRRADPERWLSVKDGLLVDND